VHRILFLLTLALLALQVGDLCGQTLKHGELLFVAPDLYSPSEADEQADPNRQRADALLQRSRVACETGDMGMALQWATRAVREDPNHADARRVLGYRRVGGTWAGNFAARRLDRGETWHQQFGWIDTQDIERWQAGERPLGKRWISAEDDARRHEKIDNGWQLRTDHFLVVTNHSLEAAADLATRLEKLYQIWQQMFGGFYLDQADLQKRFDGQATSGYRSKPFRVTYYRSREEYNAALRRRQPQIEMTLGIYFDTTRSTHFFAGPEQDAGTIYHEAVHQFFHESRPAARNVGKLANVWLIEGVACYFESLAEHNDPKIGRFISLGTPGTGRLPAALQRRLVDKYYVPLAELSALGSNDLHRRDDIARLYSQSAGLATFLIHGREGAYRPALVKLLQAIYAGRDTAMSLAEFTGRNYEQLDDEYREFLEALP
jgi:hypothetical protein